MSWREIWHSCLFFATRNTIYLTNATRNTFLFSNSCRDENCRFGTDDQNWGDFGGLIARNVFLVTTRCMFTFSNALFDEDDKDMGPFEPIWIISGKTWFFAPKHFVFGASNWFSSSRETGPAKNLKFGTVESRIFHHFHSPKMLIFWELEPNQRICGF